MKLKNAVVSIVVALMLSGLVALAESPGESRAPKMLSAKKHQHRYRHHKRYHRRHHRQAKARRPKVIEAQAASFDGERKQVGGKRDVRQVPNVERTTVQQDRVQKPRDLGPPKIGKLQRAGRAFDGDLRDLPMTPPENRERREPEEPLIQPRQIVPEKGTLSEPQTSSLAPPELLAAAPPPNSVFEGLDRFNWGAGSPPDTNGDVGPVYYIQTVNTSVGIFNKNSGTMVAAFSFNTLMSQGSFGNLCDTDNFGDPVVLYDSFEDRWIISDFAFKVDGSGNALTPAFQCFAASKSGDPVSGGWNFYSIQISDNLNDYPKLGIWPDGLYMSVNLFSFGAGSSFKGVRVWAFNKSHMYAGSPTVQLVSFDIGGGDFTVIPSNARLQTGTPPAGTPNFFVSTSMFLNALTVYKFHVDWNHIALTTLTGPSTPLAATSWPNSSPANAAQPGTANLIDVLETRAMVQNQYTNLGGVESLWVPHTVRRQDTSGLAAPRWYQVNVTGGTIAPNLPQAATWDPDGANVVNRFMPSVAVDRVGNMAMGYSASNSTTVFPSIRYAGRLATDPINTFSQTEQEFFTGTASQTTSTRWGDYSGMTLDPDGCTFWYTTEYANPADQTFNHRWLTKFGSFGPFTGCTPVGPGGIISGTVTTNPGAIPISGATVSLGNRTATTDVNGNYSFAVPAGTYPVESASFPGRDGASAGPLVLADGGVTTQNFSLTAAAANACLQDTTQLDFQSDIASTADALTAPGDFQLPNTPVVDQQNTAGTSTGTNFDATNWTGQTFVPALTGKLAQADFQLFCSGCGATPPDLTLSVRATSAGLPTGADLANVTVPGSAFASGATTTYTATFGSPATLTSGTQYALILRPVSVPAGSGYFWIRAMPSTYASGQRVTSPNSGATWSSDSARDYNFHTYMQAGFASSSDLTSSLKDANPSTGLTPKWTSFTWTATVPANTSVKFQLAGSNSQFGPFSFVGPDGTAATFYTTSGAGSLAQFTGKRYLRYKALLTTTDPAVTPAIGDVTLCFNNNILTAAPASVGGRIVMASGFGIMSARVTLSGGGLTQPRVVTTGAFGYYSFDGLEAGQTYIISVAHKRYTFSQSTRVVNLLDSIADLNFVADP